MARTRTEMGGPTEQAFGHVLRELRHERGISQEQLADLMGGNRGYISLLERGVNSPSLSMLYQLGEALHIAPSEMLARLEAKLREPPAGPGKPNDAK